MEENTEKKDKKTDLDLKKNDSKNKWFPDNFIN